MGRVGLAYRVTADDDAAFAVSLDDYQGVAGNIIRLRLRQPLRVKQVGILIIDEFGGFVEAGYAYRAKRKNNWFYIAGRTTATSSVTVIVDGVRGDDYVAETRVTKCLKTPDI